MLLHRIIVYVSAETGDCGEELKTWSVCLLDQSLHSELSQRFLTKAQAEEYAHQLSVTYDVPIQDHVDFSGVPTHRPIVI